MAEFVLFSFDLEIFEERHSFHWWIWKVPFNKAKAREKLLSPSPQINRVPNRKYKSSNNLSKSEVTRKQSTWQRLLFSDHKIYIEFQDWKYAGITSLYKFIGRTDVEAETLVLWPPEAKSWLIWKDPDAEKDWGQEEKGTIEYELAGWHHRLNGHEFG